ncbi:hypothetical protein EDD73_1224 [Heliophilum fasciatum]|uniref:Uncharacterized protein n=2 Tax=Heliophilum fasciatum TaxID=35700 RepID=A0A4R2RHZ7_9FIRM|nr:hypothetical protein EDD73_1224 [Heliophilum fasciatum]
MGDSLILTLGLLAVLALVSLATWTVRLYGPVLARYLHIHASIAERQQIYWWAKAAVVYGRRHWADCSAEEQRQRMGLWLAERLADQGIVEGDEARQGMLALALEQAEHQQSLRMAGIGRKKLNGD